jgi:hypothetical protein
VPDPRPTQFEELLTTLKASNEEMSASYVNYTISRSLPVVIKDGDDSEETPKVISKRSADLIPHYFKKGSKEKGCEFDNQQYKIGEIIETDNECIECVCSYSPIGHCLKKQNCTVE